MRLTPRPLSFVLTLALAALSGVGVVSTVHPADAGPVTNVGGAPFTKLGAYQGTLSVEIGGKALEFGNAGTDIAGSDVIQIRPSGTTTPAIFSVRNGTQTTLSIPGNVCLFPNGPGNAPDCRDTWPVAAASSLWSRTTDSDGFPALQPTDTTQHVTIGTGSVPATFGTALTLSQASANNESLQVANLTTFGPSMTVNGGTLFATANNDSPLVVTGSIYINQGGQFLPVFAGVHPEWYSAVSDAISNIPSAIFGGAGSGLDAQTLDGYRVTVESGSHCGAQACLCIDYGYTVASYGPPIIYSAPIGIKCLPMKNWI